MVIDLDATLLTAHSGEGRRDPDVEEDFRVPPAAWVRRSRRQALTRPAKGLARSLVGTGRTRAGTPTRLRRPRTEPSLCDGLRPPWTARLPRQAWPGVEAGRGPRTRRGCSGGLLLVERGPGAGRVVEAAMSQAVLQLTEQLQRRRPTTAQPEVTIVRIER